MRETFHYAAAELWKRRDRYTCFVVLFLVYLGRINLPKIMSVVRRATRRQFCAGTSGYGWRRALTPPLPQSVWLGTDDSLCHHCNISADSSPSQQ